MSSATPTPSTSSPATASAPRSCPPLSPASTPSPPPSASAREWRHRDWGSDYYRRHSRMMPVDGIDQLATGDATLLGAVGAPDIPDDVTLWGLLIPIRREFDQYVNLRPIRILPGVISPLANADRVDLVVVRENVEGEYSEIGGRRLPRAAATRPPSRRRCSPGPGSSASPSTPSSRRCAAPADSSRRPSPTASSTPCRSGTRWSGRPPPRTAGLTVEKVLIDALAARLVLKPAQHRRHRRLEPLRRHPLRPRGRRRRLDRRRAERQPEPTAAATPRCSNPSTDPLPTSPARASRTPSARSGPQSMMLEHLGEHAPQASWSTASRPPWPRASAPPTSAAPRPRTSSRRRSCTNSITSR